MALLDSLTADAEIISALRRKIHAHPELCFEETVTAKLVADSLQSWGIETHTGLAATGVVGVIHGKTNTHKRAIGLRADMDALPMQELNTFAHASKITGKMHACGHDGHTAMLLGAAKHLSANRNFDGTIYLIFQPAEEGGGGADRMIKEGLFEQFPMQAVFGLHNWPSEGMGSFAVSPGPVMASSNEFSITIHGKGGHAALPHDALDPVVVASHLIQTFQSIISRNKKPVDAAVISVTTIHAGSATNVIPDTAELTGTVRTFTLEVLDLIENRMRALTTNICEAFGVRADFSFHRNYPPTINHEKETLFARRVLEKLVGADRVLPQEPTMGAEDFSYMLMQKPGCYAFISNGTGEHRATGHGLGPCNLHNGSYDFNDALLPIGAAYWVALAQDWLAQESQNP